MKVTVKSCLLANAFLYAVSGCAMATQTGADPIVAPQEASVSPNMDFTRIKKLGVLPLFPSGAVDDAVLSESLVSALTGEIQTRQTQWTIVDYRATLELITRHNLGAGYKNLQADFNSYGGPSGAFVISAATKKFFTDLQRASGVDAFLIGTYSLSVQPVAVRSLLGTAIRNMDVATVQLSLFYAAGSQNWWTARIARGGSRTEIVDEIAKSLATNLGKGTLRQL